MTTLTTTPHKTIQGLRDLPISVEALAWMDRENAPIELAIGLKMWARLLQAQAEVVKAFRGGNKSHASIRAYAKLHALALLMADVYGRAPFFWEMEVSDTAALAPATTAW